jgi:hypothetical protein
MINRDLPLVLKNPAGPAVVLVIGRLSKPKATLQETLQTIESSMNAAKEHLEAVYDGPIDFRCLGEQISGMVADRKTMLEASDLVESGIVDLVICEELRCTYRNPRLQYAFVQDMFDAQTRFISIVDHIDTADEDWERALAFATVHHGMAVPDARRRVRRTSKYSFHSGGMVLRLKFGHRKLSKEEANSGLYGPKGLREAKVPKATPIIHEIRRRLMETRSPAAVVDWLDREGIKPGPYATRGTWSVPLLQSLLCDPKLHGVRSFRRTVYVQIFKTGKFRREKNQDPEFEFVQELAHMTLEEQMSMLATVGWEIDWGKSVPKEAHKRRGIARYKSHFPGRCTKCAACTKPMVISGDHLRCPRCLKKNGATCWNRVEVPLDLMRGAILDWLLQKFEEFPASRSAFVEAAWETIQRTRQVGSTAAESVQKEIRSLQAQQQRLVEAVALGTKGGKSLASLVDALGAIEDQIANAEKRKRKIRKGGNSLESCLTKEDVYGSIRPVLEELMRTSFEFNEVMRKFFPSILIVPVQKLDTLQVYPRCKICFQPIGDDGTLGDPIEAVFDVFSMAFCCTSRVTNS